MGLYNLEPYTLRLGKVIIIIDRFGSIQVIGHTGIDLELYPEQE